MPSIAFLRNNSEKQIQKLRELWIRFRYYYLDYKLGRFSHYLQVSEPIEGWVNIEERVALARQAYDLPENATIGEIGSFLGESAIVMAGARKLKGSGKVHCIDPFDASGDAFSVPVYEQIRSAASKTLRERFDDNISYAGLTDWVSVHVGTADTVIQAWREPIDMLFLDGDQSPEGARKAYEAWAPFVRKGGIIALHNSTPREYDENHDGHYRIAMQLIQSPKHKYLRSVFSTTFFVKSKDEKELPKRRWLIQALLVSAVLLYEVA